MYPSKLIQILACCIPLTLTAQTEFHIALIGDMPYGAAAEAPFERVIADINRQNVDMTFHIGDTKVRFRSLRRFTLRENFELV